MGMRRDGTCPECGATEVMTDVMVRDRDDHMTREAELSVERNPEAILFTGTTTSAMKACVCGQCGLVELYVVDPSELWDAYKAARNR